MINRALEARVPLPRQLHDVPAEIGTRIADFAEECFAAGQQTAVEQTDRQFGILRIDLIALLRRVDGLADPQAAVPEIAQEHG